VKPSYSRPANQVWAREGWVGKTGILEYWKVGMMERVQRTRNNESMGERPEEWSGRSKGPVDVASETQGFSQYSILPFFQYSVVSYLRTNT
jgi:hypothetical protein